MRVYNDECVTRYDEILATARSASDLKRRFCDKLVTTMVDAEMHRLWYDLRNQALFEPVVQANVIEIDMALQRMIWRIVSRYGELRGHRAKVAEDVAYRLFDGDRDAQSRLRSQAGRVLDTMFD